MSPARVDTKVVSSLAVATIALFALGCSDEGGAPDAGPVPAATAARACGIVPKAYTGLDGKLLARDRDETPSSQDIMRIKPFTALLGDYRRIFGTPPRAAFDAASTFGVVPPRWFAEPQAGAISLFAAHRIAFAGCVSLMPSHEAWATMPSEEEARSQCTQWGREFWGHPPDTAQRETCVKFVTNDALFSGATPPVTNAGERWAAGCAMMLTTEEFLSY